MDATKATSEQTRAEEALFVSQCGLLSLWKQLPLHWPTPLGTPPSPKKRYRSEYVYPWRAALANPDQVLAWKSLSDFDLALRLVDFGGLRPVLAQLLGWKSRRGWEPFDPVSFFSIDCLANCEPLVRFSSQGDSKASKPAGNSKQSKLRKR